LRPLPWREPLAALAPFSEEPFALGLLSAGVGWSYVARAPVRTLLCGRNQTGDPLAVAAHWLGPVTPAGAGPPFQGGVAGLLGYELGARYEPVPSAGLDHWPDAALGLYAALLAFDHDRRQAWAIGRGADAAEASVRAEAAAAWPTAALAPQNSLADGFAALDSAAEYAAHVARVITRIEAGELFQANIARRWRGRLRPGVTPFALFAGLQAESPAPFAAYLRLPGRAVVSNSPERFLSVDASGQARTEPIKGTRPRGDDAAEDAALAAELLASDKDRAENLMIVDLMRNDLARVCAPGSVDTTRLFAVERYANVHHLVSTVRGRLRSGATAVDLLRAAFPPGSVTGAPKVQAMRVISELEPPRGPYCGAMFWAGFDGAMDSSVLIRTAAFVERGGRWTFEARAGAGIVGDSDPELESLETEAKIDALARALRGAE